MFSLLRHYRAHAALMTATAFSSSSFGMFSGGSSRTLSFALMTSTPSSRHRSMTISAPCFSGCDADHKTHARDAPDAGRACEARRRRRRDFSLTLFQKSIVYAGEDVVRAPRSTAGLPPKVEPCDPWRESILDLFTEHGRRLWAARRPVPWRWLQCLGVIP